MTVDRLNAKVLLVARLPELTVSALAASVHMLDGREPGPRAQLVAEHGTTIRGIATNGHDGADRALISALPELEIIACFSAGVDAIDMAAAQERGIPVTATSSVLADDVADLAMALSLMLLRRLNVADGFIRAGGWSKGEFPLGRALRGRQLGILGMGTIGQAIAARAQVSGMSIAYTSRTAKPQLAHRFIPTLADLAAESDVLVVCCPATPETFHMVDAGVLARLGNEGFLINIARGSVVDEAALVAALQARVIAGAGLDVFEDEPRPNPALLAMDQVVLTPHIGSGTAETRAEMGRHMIDSLCAKLG